MYLCNGGRRIAPYSVSYNPGLHRIRYLCGKMVQPWVFEYPAHDDCRVYLRSVLQGVRKGKKNGYMGKVVPLYIFCVHVPHVCHRKAESCRDNNSLISSGNFHTRYNGIYFHCQSVRGIRG